MKGATKMKKRVLPILLAVIMLAAMLPLSTGSSKAIGELTEPVGMDLSEMNTTDIDGNAVTGDLFGEYELTLLNYWATWCGPCKNEMPDLQEFYMKYRDKGINVVGVLSEGNGSTPESANKWCSSNGITYSHLRVDSVLNELILKTRVGQYYYVPDSFLVNSEGVVLAAGYGAFSTLDDIENWVKPFRPEPEGISVGEDITLDVNRMMKLEVTAQPKHAIIPDVEWSSSDESVMTVNNGVVTGISEGTAILTAKVVSKTSSNGMTAECTVTVKAAEEFEDGTVYYRPTKNVRADKSYMIVAKYDGRYYAMTDQHVESNRFRLAGFELNVDDLVLTDDGVIMLAADENLMWTFQKHEEHPNAFDVVSAGERHLTTIRNIGIFKLSTKNKVTDAYWTVENGRLRPDEESYTDERKYVSYYDNNGFIGFDLLEADDKNFVEILFYEKTVYGHENESDYEKGDVNRNGTLDTGDATMILRYSVGLEELDDEQLELANVNGNDVVGADDATLILRAIVS